MHGPGGSGRTILSQSEDQNEGPLGRVRVQAPDLRGHWVYKVPGGVGRL